jgi:ribonucleoside-diphosphate reductase alpha chain
MNEYIFENYKVYKQIVLKNNQPNMGVGMMIEKVKQNDGTIVDFNLVEALSTISQRLLEKGDITEQRAGEMAQNIVELISEKFISSVPCTKDFDELVSLVLQSSLPNTNTVENENTTISNISSESNDSSQSVQEEKVPNTEVKDPDNISNKNLTHLLEHNVLLSDQAQRILQDSICFNELGRSIFLDRYALKVKRDTIVKGDLVVALTKEDRKYPIKDLGIVTEINEDDLTLHMITGKYADAENKFLFNTNIMKCDKPSESIKDAHVRIAHAIASVEKTPELQEYWANEFLTQLQEKNIQPAGRIMTGASHGGSDYTKNLTLFNCYVIPSPPDSRDGIIKETLYQMTEIMSRGGGVGINLSSLRPRFAYVKGVHGKSSGAVSWGGIFSYATALIEQGGSRRGALMLMMYDWHPDVLEFISAKQTKGVIENANVSVLISDKFMAAVANDDVWNLEFPDYENSENKAAYDSHWNGTIEEWKAKGLGTKIYKTVKARDMWDKIIRCAHGSAEPGIVFYERYNKLSNSYYFNPIICTNPCGEQGLPAWGVCNLGHLYLASFVKEVGNDSIGPLFEFDWERLTKATGVLTRFLDNVIDKTPYHFKENEENQKGERRIGLGTLGLGELLVKLRLRYGSDASLQFIDTLFKKICEEGYKTSCIIAEEKGAFPMFDAEKFIQSGFIQTLSDELKSMIQEKGIRNVTITTQAPTGTVGTMLATTTGIEPYYAFEYYRQSRMGFHKVKIPLAEQYTQDDGSLPEYFITAMEMTPNDHIRVQAAVQKWTDSSISKTANAPENFTIEETKHLYEEAYRLGCKGVTIYRDNCRYEQVLSTDEGKGDQNAQSSQEVGHVTSSGIVEELPEVPKVDEGTSCELKVDEYGQTYKSCSE